jgi:hypothetical protein
VIYLEFIDWDRATPMEVFRYLSPQDQWSDPADEKVINIGRHKGIGAHPAYLSGWRIGGFARLDEWDRHFKSEEALKDLGEKAAFLGMNFDYCGLYDDLVLDALPDENLHAVEYYELADELEDDAFIAAARARESDEHAGRLAVVLRRIGTLGPGPAGIVMWTFPSFESLEPFVRRRTDGAPRPYLTGLFRNIGHELM